MKTQSPPNPSASEIAAQKHFVTFLSPGSFVHEESSRPIPSWDVAAASQMAHDVWERHGATPFAFYFTTRARTAAELDSKETKRSGRYFLGGKIETLEEVEARNSPDERILRANMRGNGYNRIITNTNSWKVTQPFEDDDTLLDWSPKNTACTP